MTLRAKRRAEETPEAMRKCIATGEVCPKSELLRFVIGPDSAVVFDAAGKLPGRGIWVRAERSALQLAVKKKLFSRSAKMQLDVPAGLEEQVEAALTARLVSLLSLARKSGKAVAGATKVKAWCVDENVAALFQAGDGSPREKSKIRLYGDGKTFECLSKTELGEAFGREFAVHAALATGGLAARVIEEATRLTGFRPEAPHGRMKG